MKLYCSHTSPYARKVRLLIHEKGAVSRVKEETVAAMEDPAALHEANPLGKVPALVMDDGTSWFDSPVICEVLDAVLEGPSLIPASNVERFRVLRQQAIADGIMDAAVSIIFERNRKDAERSATWLGRWERAILRSLALLEAEVTDLDGPVDLGVISVGAALGYLDFRHAPLGWQDKFPELAGWWRDIAKRRSFVDTAPPA
ncbi:MAG: glutathione S-transferase N-terminal domain-containing protein [Alphaproteobacteria bacterium]|nr:glutathione S-transferase N-terminal domain-containing protein [Alphaproteobacteria bacterium]MDX5417410.1 glutathione S-transferase N-terminal domain-containing protein [Alphaproteobacteria bacterium]MDX5494883.1 glutathione S-transferase N-terminal domain-containing protein [Alphaproteobacteria bacterium]